MAKRSTELLKGNTPALVLSVLRRERMHGYAIARRIESLSEGYFRLNEGSLYPALHALEREGLVEAEWAEVDGRRRKEYRITPAGKVRLRELAEEFDQFTNSVQRVLRGVVRGGASAS